MYSVCLFQFPAFLPRRLDSQNCLYLAIDFGCLAARVKNGEFEKTAVNSNFSIRNFRKNDRLQFVKYFLLDVPD